MTRFLRFLGMLNVAVWLGAAYFFAVGLPLAVSPEAAPLIKSPSTTDYLAVEVWQMALGRLFYLQIVCAILALLHMVAEWLYLGRTVKNLWRILIYALFVLSLAGGIWLAPKLRELNRIKYSPTKKPEERSEADKLFRRWQGIFVAVNVLMVGGLGAYFWRTTNPPDELRFVGSSNFRG